MLAATLPDMAENTPPEPAAWAIRMERLRADLGLTQSDLARKADIPLPRLKSYIQGRARQPRGTEIADIAKALKVDPFWLQHGIDPPNATAAPIQMPPVLSANNVLMPAGGTPSSDAELRGKRGCETGMSSVPYR